MHTPMPTCPNDATAPIAADLVETTIADDDADPARIHHLVILGHPAPDSFNHAIARTFCEAVEECGQRATLHDLYANGFDPLLKADERPNETSIVIADDVRAELALVGGAANITLVYPIWYGMPPAIITGYVDRVLGTGLTGRDIRNGHIHSLTRDKRLTLLTTSGSTLAWLSERGQWLGLREAFDYYLEFIFSFASSDHEHFDSIVDPLSADYAAECLGRVADRARQTCATLLSAAHERQKRKKLYPWQAVAQKARSVPSSQSRRGIPTSPSSQDRER